MWIMVDVEATGPCPGLYSMTEFAAMAVTREMDNVFYRGLWMDDSLPTRVAYTEGTTKLVKRDRIVYQESPVKVMKDFAEWLGQFDNVRFMSDNNGFDWQFINYYFHKYYGSNPLGYSSTNLGTLYKGCVKNMRQNFKHLRDTKHTHDPRDDVRGNVEALIKIVDKFSLLGFDVLNREEQEKE
jgi:DNA polymerase III alpha subunit (gram-positive type)